MVAATICRVVFEASFLDGDWRCVRKDVQMRTGIMNWRVGRKVARTVYENDQIMFLCTTPEDAQRIVAALNQCDELRSQLEQSRKSYQTKSPCGHAENFLIGDEHGHFTCTVCQRDEWRSQANHYREQRDQQKHLVNVMAKRIDELEQDRERLDWLDANGTKFRIFKVYNADFPPEHTAREAIDAARGVLPENGTAVSSKSDEVRSK